jgi:hypothetical protein
MIDLAEFNLSEIMRSLLEQADEDGMKMPFIVCAISPNGSVMIVRFTAFGVEGDFLAKHSEPEGFRLPMTIALIDQDNRAIRGEITAQGKVLLQ